MKRSLIVSLLVLSLAGCNAKADTVRIGFITPLTGDAANMGKDILNGTQMAVDEINAAGGIGGKQVELIAEDGRCNAGDAAAAAQKLVNVDGVVALIGGACSSETLAAAPIAAAAKIVQIASVSSSPKITGFSPFLFRNYPSDALKGKAFGAFIEKAGFKKIALLSENTDFCQGVRSSVKDNLPSGATVVFDEVVDPGTKDFRTLMTRLKGEDFDLFVMNGQSDAINAEMVKQLRAVDLKQQIIGSDTADSVSLGTLAGVPLVEGLKAMSVASLDESNPRGSQFGSTFRQRFGEPKYSLYFAALSYDATMLTLKTIGDVGSGEAQRQAFLALKGYDGLTGTFRFDANGDVIGIPFGLKTFTDGKPVLTEVIPVN